MMDSSTHLGATLERLGHEAIRNLIEGPRGDLVTSDNARPVWNGLINAYPALIARCAGAADVMTVISLVSTTSACQTKNPQSEHANPKLWFY